ncbi:TIGR00366 family protein [Fictibacillus sp. Mic-4]|uniref:TIGR00366 family protein n=1 Tax=Fictibacillus sp. Mic-4 TaxID=3132826 RepID=UPI003CF9E518
MQGPLIMPAAHQLGVDPGIAAMAIEGLGVRDIMGYCVTTLLVSGVIFTLGLTLF